MISTQQPESRFRSVLLLMVAALLAAVLVDMGFILVRAPSLLLPGHLYGLLHLLLSCLVLYAIVAVILGGYLVLLAGFMRLFRFRPGSRAITVMIISFPLFMLLLKKLQTAMLGTYTSVRSPLFLVPLIIVLAALFLATGIAAWSAKRFFARRARRAGRLRFLRHLLLFVVLCLAAGLLFGRAGNVLGIIDEADQRAQHRERILDPMPPAAEGAPNFVVVIIECFRSDFFTRENAPFLWDLAQENVYFSRYYNAAPATRPSVTSLFLSLYPAQHGCYNLAGGETSGGTRMRIRVPENAEAFPRRLQDNGYRTLMVTSNGMVMDPLFGFERIFNSFSANDPYRFRAPFLEPFHGFQFLRSAFAYFRLFNIIVFSPDHSVTYFDGSRLNQTIRRELPGTAEPFLLYVHYIEPHAPYYAHPYRAMQINLYLPSLRDKILEYYRQEIEAADAAVRDLYEYLAETGKLENTYLLITSDHGEEFYDHGDWGHGKSLFPEVLHVPAIMVPPPHLRTPLRVDRPVDNVDIAPTLTALAGLPASDSWEGESLLPYFTRKGNGPERHTAAGTVMSQFDDGQRFFASAIAGDYQIILRQQGEEEAFFLYNLADDPRARNNLYGTGLAFEDSLVIYLDQALLRMYETAAVMSGEEEEIDDELLEQLKTLGYIE